MTTAAEFEVSIKTETGVRVSISKWDDGGAWLHLCMRNGTAYAALTEDEAEQLLTGLQSILAKEVSA